jgi:N-acetylglucosaminyldiphosphoundecaprenol N-acetyl-beta-D-mannosaminyltransferase
MSKVAAQRPTNMRLLGIPVNNAGSGEVYQFIEQLIRDGEKGMALHLNIHAFTLAMRHRWLHELICSSHLNFCDGDGVRWGLRIMGHRPPAKTGYTRWIWELAEFCALKGYSLYLLGGRAGIAEETGRRLVERFPRLKIAGTHHGEFEKTGPQNDAVVQVINAAKPDLLLVCFGMPLQEQWIGQNWASLDANVFLQGGGVFDYVAGKVEVPPEWMVRANLEWLARIIAEPRRLAGRYAFDIPVFFGRVLLERMRRMLPSPGSGAQRS